MPNIQIMEPELIKNGRHQGNKRRSAATRSNSNRGCAGNGKEETVWKKNLLQCYNKLNGENGHSQTPPLWLPLTRGTLHNKQQDSEKKSKYKLTSTTTSNIYQSPSSRQAPALNCKHSLPAPYSSSQATPTIKAILLSNSLHRWCAAPLTSLILRSTPFTATTQHPWCLSLRHGRRGQQSWVSKMTGSGTRTSQASHVSCYGTGKP